MEVRNSERDNKADQIFLILLLVTVSIYGFVIYNLFLAFFGHARNPSGVMLTSFLIGLPVSVGILVSFLLRKYTQISSGKIYAYCLIPLAATVILSYVFMGEGVICILMASPIFIVTLMFGAFLGSNLAKYEKLRSGKFVSILAFAPLALGVYEQNINPLNSYQHFEKEIFINAPPSDIWPILLNPRNIQEKELARGYVYKIGAPYPVEAITKAAEVGGVRHSVWQKGVAFDEVITDLIPYKLIAWKYHFDESSFPSGSLDDHIKIGGTYFDITGTSYELAPKDKGTILRLKVDYRVSTNFNWYANIWGQFFVGNTAETLLGFYKNRSESIEKLATPSKT